MRISLIPGHSNREPLRPGIVSAIDAIYFSCKRDVDLVRMSLASLRKLGLPIPIKVIIDASDPMNDDDIRQLAEVSPQVTVISSSNRVERHGASGLRNIVLEVTWFWRILAARPPQHMLVKLDSDTLLIGRRIFDQVANIRPYAMGSPISIDGITFARGACYFLRRDAVYALYRLLNSGDFESSINRHLDGDDRVIAPKSYEYSYPEDRLIHKLLSLWNRYSVHQSNFVLDVDSASCDNQDMSSVDVLHFPGHSKTFMRSYYRQFIHTGNNT